MEKMSKNKSIQKIDQIQKIPEKTQEIDKKCVKEIEKMIKMDDEIKKMEEKMIKIEKIEDLSAENKIKNVLCENNGLLTRSNCA